MLARLRTKRILHAILSVHYSCWQVENKILGDACGWLFRSIIIVNEDFLYLMSLLLNFEGPAVFKREA